jgi:hypothetical protein
MAFSLNNRLILRRIKSFFQLRALRATFHFGKRAKIISFIRRAF